MDGRRAIYPLWMPARYTLCVREQWSEMERMRSLRFEVCWGMNSRLRATGLKRNAHPFVAGLHVTPFAQ